MVTPAMDIYSFGMCALETAALEIQGNGDSGTHVTEELIARTVESLEEPRQKDFIYRYILTMFLMGSNLYLKNPSQVNVANPAEQRTKLWYYTRTRPTWWFMIRNPLLKFGGHLCPLV